MRTNKNLRLVIADDGSPDKTFINHILKGINGLHYYTDAKRGGIGASLNRALETLPDNAIWLYNTDDWILHQTLDLTQALWLLDNGYEYVRLGPIHPNLKCITKFNQEAGWWLEIDPMFGYAFATRPFIATHKFWRTVGPFKEKVNAYIAERDYSDRVANFDEVLHSRLAQIGHIPLEGYWTHIGEEEVGTITP